MFATLLKLLKASKTNEWQVLLVMQGSMHLQEALPRVAADLSSTWRLCDRSPLKQQVQPQKPVWPSVTLASGMAQV